MCIRDRSITNVNAHSLGIEGINMATMRKENSHVIVRNTPLPCVANRKFVTKHENQQSVVIQVLEGEGKTADGCMPLGRAVIRNLPPGLPAGHPIHVEYRYDTSGRLAVRGHIPGYGDQAIIELQRVGSLSSTRLAAWKKVVCKDGGFDDFHAAIDDLLDSSDSLSDTNVDPVVFDDLATAPRGFKTEEPAAVDFGAPPVAAEILKNEFSPSPKPAFKGVSPDPTSKPAFQGTSPDPELNLAPAEDKPKQPSYEPFSTVRRRRKGGGWWYIVGHIMASTIGLAVGYYLLVQIRPEANFLNLDLPTWKQVTEEQK